MSSAEQADAQRSGCPPLRLFCVDDSGAEDTGYATFSWIDFLAQDWKVGLRQVLDWRKQLSLRYDIPATYELHATKFANGRGNPSLDPPWNQSKANRTIVMKDAMDFLARSAWLSVGTVYSQTNLRRRQFSGERARVYGELIKMLDQRLTADGELGMLVMDGDGSDESYLSAHRNLPLATRSLIEDPIFQHSYRSQLVQLADLAASAGYQHLLHHDRKRFAWEWYPSLAGQNEFVEPQPV